MLLLLYRGELGICWNILKESSLFKNEIKAIFIIIFLTSCSLFEEVEVPLDGERENVFEIDEKKLVKSFVKVYLPKPKLVEDWNQNNQNKSNHLFHFSSQLQCLASHQYLHLPSNKMHYTLLLQYSHISSIQ